MDSPEAAPGPADILVDAFENGNIPKQAITYTGGERAGTRSRRASCCSCATGRTSTAWPTTEALQGEGQVRRRPAARHDGLGASTLGGHSLGISAYSDNKATAIDFMKFILERSSSRSS